MVLTRSKSRTLRTIRCFKCKQALTTLDLVHHVIPEPGTWHTWFPKRVIHVDCLSSIHHDDEGFIYNRIYNRLQRSQYIICLNVTDRFGDLYGVYDYHRWMYY